MMATVAHLMLKVFTQRNVPPGEALMLAVLTYVLPLYVARPAIRYPRSREMICKKIAKRSADGVQRRRSPDICAFHMPMTLLCKLGHGGELTIWELRSIGDPKSSRPTRMTKQANPSPATNLRHSLYSRLPNNEQCCSDMGFARHLLHSELDKEQNMIERQ